MSCSECLGFSLGWAKENKYAYTAYKAYRVVHHLELNWEFLLYSGSTLDVELQFKHEVELKWSAIQIHAFLNRKGKFANTNLNVDLTKKVLKKLKSSGWMDGLYS